MKEEIEYCHFCDDGLYESITEEHYKVELLDGSCVIIPEVYMLRCPTCGEFVFSLEECQRIQDYIKAHSKAGCPVSEKVTKHDSASLELIIGDKEKSSDVVRPRGNTSPVELTPLEIVDCDLAKNEGVSESNYSLEDDEYKMAA